MAPAAPPDQRRQAGPGPGPGNLPATGRPIIGATGRGGTESVRGGRRRRAQRTRCPSGANPPAAPDRPPSQRRPDQRPDRRPSLPVTAHGQLAPVPVVSQARGGQSQPAPRRDRPRQQAAIARESTGREALLVAPLDEISKRVRALCAWSLGDHGATSWPPLFASLSLDPPTIVWCC